MINFGQILDYYEILQTQNQTKTMNATTAPTKTETIQEIAVMLANASTKEQLDHVKECYGESAVQVAWSGLSEIVKRRLIKICVPNAKPAPIETETPQETPAPTPPAQMTTAPQEPPAPKVKQAKSKKSAPKLWELADDVIALGEQLDDLDEDEDLTESEREELGAQLFAEWMEADDAFEEKAENTALFIKHQEAVSEAQKAEGRRIWDNGIATENGAKRMRKYLTAYCLKVGKKSIKVIKASLSIRKKPAKVILTVEPENLPEEFKKVEVSPKLAKIKEYLKEHPDCDFASFSLLEEFNVTIR